MGTLKHPLVEDRIIEGTGTSRTQWLCAFEQKPLPALDLEQFRSRRVVVIAPHPDDEILGCGGLLQQLSTLNCELVIVAVSNGTQSHPESRKYSPEQLDQIRPQESVAALHCLGLFEHTRRIALNLTDGQIHLHSEQLWQALNEHVVTGDILICSYAKDGHPDHEAVGKTVQAFAAQHDLTCWHVMIWAWHWARPDDPRISWQKAQSYRLTPSQLTKKRQAIMQFKSQIEADDTTGKAAVLSPAIIDRLLMPWEVYLYE